VSWQGKPKYSEKTCPFATLSITKSHMTKPGFEPGPPRWEASYGAAYPKTIVRLEYYDVIRHRTRDLPACNVVPQLCGRVQKFERSFFPSYAGTHFFEISADAGIESLNLVPPSGDNNDAICVRQTSTRARATSSIAVRIQYAGGHLKT
jgi:hypothetical protein